MGPGCNGKDLLPTVILVSWHITSRFESPCLIVIKHRCMSFFVFILIHVYIDNRQSFYFRAAKTYTADTDKANALNAQFHSVISPKSPISLKQLAQKTLQDLQDFVKPPPPSIPTSQHDPGMNPSFKPSPHPKMPDIQVSSNGIEQLLKGLNPHKAAGPDQLKPIVLQTLHK